MKGRWGGATAHGALLLSLTVGLTVALAATEAAVLPLPAVAADTYSDSDAVDCSKTYGKYSWCKGNPSSWLSARGYGYRNCTDWAAFRIKELIGVTLPVTLGHGKDWNDKAPNNYVQDMTPEPGDIAQSEGPAGDEFGHVGIVEKVTKDSVGRTTSIEVSEYNKNRDGRYTSDLYVPDANGVYWRDTARTKKWDVFIDVNGTGEGIGGEDDLTVATPSTNPYAVKNVTVVPNMLGGLSLFTASDTGLMGYKDQSRPGEDLKTKPWGSITASLKGTPEIVTYPNGALSVFGHGNDGRLHHAWQTRPGTAWSGDISPWNVSLRGEPTTAFNFTGGASVFFPDSNGAMREIDQIGAGTDMGSSPVHNLGGSFQGKPAVMNIEGAFALFAHGADGLLYTKYQSARGGSWSGWEALGGQKIHGAPKVIINRLGGMTVLAIGERGDIVGIDQLYRGESMNKPFCSLAKPAGVNFVGTPGVIQTTNGEQMVFATAANGAVYHKAQAHTNHYNWTDFFPLGGNLIGAPAIARNSSGGASIFGRNSDGTVVTLDQVGYGRSFNTTWIGLGKP